MSIERFLVNENDGILIFWLHVKKRTKRHAFLLGRFSVPHGLFFSLSILGRGPASHHPPYPSAGSARLRRVFRLGFASLALMRELR